MDVRSKGELQDGHIKGSINIFVDTLRDNLDKLKKTSRLLPVAYRECGVLRQKTLKSNGSKKVQNGGGWGTYNIN